MFVFARIGQVTFFEQEATCAEQMRLWKRLCVFVCDACVCELGTPASPSVSVCGGRYDRKCLFVIVFVHLPRVWVGGWM